MQMSFGATFDRCQRLPNVIRQQQSGETVALINNLPDYPWNLFHVCSKWLDFWLVASHFDNFWRFPLNETRKLGRLITRRRKNASIIIIKFLAISESYACQFSLAAIRDHWTWPNWHLLIQFHFRRFPRITTILQIKSYLCHFVGLKK